MTKLEDLTGLTFYDVKLMKKKIDDFIQTPEFNSIHGFGRRSAYRRVAVHLNHILSGFRMEETNKFESITSIYSANRLKKSF